MRPSLPFAQVYFPTPLLMLDPVDDEPQAWQAASASLGTATVHPQQGPLPSEDGPFDGADDAGEGELGAGHGEGLEAHSWQRFPKFAPEQQHPYEIPLRINEPENDGLQVGEFGGWVQDV